MNVSTLQKNESDKAAKVVTASAPATPTEVASESGVAAGVPLFLQYGVQAKLTVGATDDPLEHEADRVADAVMAKPPDEAALSTVAGRALHRKPATSATAATVTSGPADVGALGPGAPLGASARAYFEPRFGHDFSHVRLHSGPEAAHAVREFDAQAFALGPHIAFGEGRYDPHSDEGKRLMAHELAHVVQTGGQHSQKVMRHRHRTPAPSFVLGSSEVGQRIRTGLEADSASMPGSTHDAPRVRLVDPGEVFEILESSPLFIDEARQVERLYFIDRTRTPELTFLFHLHPDLGSEFQRGESRVVVQVTNLREVVRSTVHEIVHARHDSPTAAAATRRVGEVTRTEQAGVREEAQTRMQERRIMAEIAGQDPWQRLTGDAEVEAAPRRAADLYEEVREDFVSGWPKLTYQEYFILGAMKANTRIPGIDESTTQTVAHLLYDPMRSPRVENATSFRPAESDMTHYQQVAAAPAPVLPPSRDEAMECGRRYRANRDWQRAFNRDNRLPPEDVDLSRSCRAFIEGYQSPLWTGPIPYVPEWAYARAMRFEPTDRYERFGFFADLLMEMSIAYEIRVSARQQGSAISQWYNSVPEESRSGALEYLEWLMIEEAIAREWQRLGVQRSDPEVRRQHLDFLEARIGRPLRGVSRSGLPSTP